MVSVQGSPARRYDVASRRLATGTALPNLLTEPLHVTTRRDARDLRQFCSRAVRGTELKSRRLASSVVSTNCLSVSYPQQGRHFVSRCNDASTNGVLDADVGHGTDFTQLALNPNAPPLR